MVAVVLGLGVIVAGAVAFAAGALNPAGIDASGALHGFTAANYPIYSAQFSGSPSPFHETVKALIAKGAVRQPPAVAANLWKQSIQSINVGHYRLPIYFSTASDPAYRFSCVTYGACHASGMTIHAPPWAHPSEDSDHHLLVFDRAIRGELDGWGGDGHPDHACAAQSGSIACSWGGYFPFSGNGLDGNSGDSANNGGFAFGIFLVSAAEVLQGHIDHAMGMFTSCLDNPDIYPADTTKGTDSSCSGRTNAGNPQYGQLIRLRDGYDIANSPYSPECKTFLTALQTYGAYTFDTNNSYGIGLDTDDVTLYADPNPWYTKIFPSMARSGDAEGSGTSFHFSSCLNRLSAGDIEVYDLAPGS